jgi:hypothetical protein
LIEVLRRVEGRRSRLVGAKLMVVKFQSSCRVWMILLNQSGSSSSKGVADLMRSVVGNRSERVLFIERSPFI